QHPRTPKETSAFASGYWTCHGGQRPQGSAAPGHNSRAVCSGGLFVRSRTNARWSSAFIATPMRTHGRKRNAEGGSVISQTTSACKRIRNGSRARASDRCYRPARIPGVLVQNQQATPAARALRGAAIRMMRRIPVSMIAAVSVFLLLGGVAHAEQSVTLAWDPVSGSDGAGFVMCYGTQQGGRPTHLDVGNQTMADVTGLADGTTYYFVVQSYTSGGVLSAPSDEIAWTTDGSAGPPSVPAGPVPADMATGVPTT